MTYYKGRSLLTAATAAVALSISGAGMAQSVTFAPLAVAAVQHTGGGHDSGASHADSSQHATDSGQRKGQGKKPGETTGRGHGSMEDIFREVGSEEEDSDRPVWAGGGGGPNDRGGKPADAGSARGDLYGDLYVILRDEDGVPILNDAGFVQPIDANGNLIPLDAEGAPIDLTLVQEVELSRLNVGRSPTSVLDRRAAEVVTLLQTATAISFDESGRLVLTVDGVTKTIDSPLENLALYVALMTTGTIPGVTDLPGTEYDYLVDGQFTTADLAAAVGLLAAASDKYTSLTPDTVAYINAILGINTVTTGDVTYSSMDYSAYTYDRSDTYDNVMVTVLVKQPDGSYVPTQVDLYDVVFSGEDFSESGTFDAFATAVDDARAVLAYIHDNEAPE
jgi:hypothetical protein